MLTRQRCGRKAVPLILHRIQPAHCATMSVSVFVYLCICVFVCLYFVQNTTGVHALQTCNVFGGLTPNFNTVPVSALVVALHSECLPQNLDYS